MKKILWLDDLRNPFLNVEDKVPTEEGELHWVLNYWEFVDWINKFGLPDVVSFDHDLAFEHYTPKEYWTSYETSKAYQDSQSYTEKTGKDCANWLVEYCLNRGLPLPIYYAHSANPVGADNIRGLLNNYSKFYTSNQLKQSIRKKILYVDMDETICHFNKFILGVNPNVVFDTESSHYKERCHMVEDVMLNNPRLFKDLEPIEGAIDAVNRLWEYFDVYFLSTPCWMIPESYTDKRLWIGNHFGEKAENGLILTQRKDLCFGEFLVDDRTANGAGNFLGEHILFGKEPFGTWKEVELYLMDRVVFKPTPEEIINYRIL